MQIRKIWLFFWILWCVLGATYYLVSDFKIAAAASFGVGALVAGLQLFALEYAVRKIVGDKKSDQKNQYLKGILAKIIAWAVFLIVFTQGQKHLEKWPLIFGLGAVIIIPLLSGMIKKQKESENVQF